ncbi:MAG: class I SAM-dependent methyltransferase [Halobacteria archaeon]|nr:class I SAM-dependent methyltransferase [Halobacteria archaeon]
MGEKEEEGEEEDMGFEEAYHGIPPWDIGRPQPEIVRLSEEDEIRGSVLDVGCGTGENALYLAEKGHEVWGIDASPTAIRKAHKKSIDRSVDVTFLIWNALKLGGLGKEFDTVVDSGLFHVFTDDERTKFVNGLHGVLKPGGTYYMLCFSENQPGTWGPRRIKKEEILSAFSGPWEVNYVEDVIFETTFDPPEIKAYLVSVTRD